MIRHAHLECRAAELEQFVPEAAKEQWVSVEDKAARWVVNLAADFHEQLGNFEGCVLCRERPEVDPF